MKWWRRAVIFLIAAAVTGVFFINFCGTVYQCGCQSLWSGASAQCNVHQAHSRHCPWCAVPGAGGAVMGLMLAGQAVVAFGPWAMAGIARLAAALAAFPMVGAVMAVALGWYTGYWN